MKPLTSSLLALLLIVSFGTTGCSTVNPDGTTSGPVLDEQTLADAALILRGTARSAAVLALEDKPSSRKGVELAVSVLDNLIIGETYTPGDVTEKMKPIIKEAGDPKIALAVNAVLDTYTIFYGRYAKGQIRQNQTAALFLTALLNGAKDALEISKPTQ